MALQSYKKKNRGGIWTWNKVTTYDIGVPFGVPRERFIFSPQLPTYLCNHLSAVRRRRFYLAALVDLDKMSTEEIYYWRGMAKGNLEDWDGAAQDLRRAHLLNPNFLPAGKELKWIHSLGLASSLDDSPNPILTDLISSQKPYFITIAGSSIASFQSDSTENAK